MSSRAEVHNLSQRKLLAGEAWVAEGIFRRMLGLIGHRRLREGEALIIYDCYAVHTWFMSFPLDVIFIGEDKRAVYLVRWMKPYRFSGVIKDAQIAIELPAGTIDASGTLLGDRLYMDY